MNPQLFHSHKYLFLVGLTNFDGAKGKLKNGESKAVGEKFVYVQAENITEWTHEFNPNDPRNSIFWVLSRDVCWYQIQVSRHLGARYLRETNYILTPVVYAFSLVI